VNVSCYKAYFRYYFTESKYCTIFHTKCPSYKYAVWRKLSDSVVVSGISEKCVFLILISDAKGLMQNIIIIFINENIYVIYKLRKK
jgi:hypothetical protein